MPDENGPAVTDAPPPDKPTGWYPDPKQQASERFWNDDRWTEITRTVDEAKNGAATMDPLPPDTLPGWYADPKQETSERFWYGNRWTEITRETEAQPLLTPRSAWDAEVDFNRHEARRKKYIATGVTVSLLVVAVLAISITASVNSSLPTDRSLASGDRSVGTSADGDHSTSSGSSTDPIEQARAVLAQRYGESFTYADVKSATDAALSATGESVSDTNRSRGWSSILGALKAPELSAVSPMGVMRCVAREGVGADNAGMGFPEIAAFCAVLLM